MGHIEFGRHRGQSAVGLTAAQAQAIVPGKDLAHAIGIDRGQIARGQVERDRARLSGFQRDRLNPRKARRGEPCNCGTRK